MSMSFLRAVAASVLLWPVAPASAQEHRYDVFAAAIGPFVSLFAPDTPDKALRLELELLEATGLDPRFQGVRASVALEMPDRLLLTGITRDDVAMLCRDGQRVWAFPAAPVREIVGAVAPGVLEMEGGADVRLRDFTLPIPRKQMVLLPALFHVEDAGEEVVDGERCRVLDISLLPELATSLDAVAWSARLWVNEQRVPARLRMSKGSAKVVVAFRTVSFEQSLPAVTWAAPEEGEVVELTPAQLERLVQAVLRQFN